MARFSNWAGQYGCTPARVHHAASAADVAAAIAAATQAGRQLRVLGAGHSPSDIAMSDEDLLLLDGMTRILSVDVPNGRVRVQAGASLGDIARAADAAGLAFPVLGSIDAQTIAGATATATHGTGAAFGVLSSLIVDLDLVTPSGASLHCSEESHSDVWHAARCGLGAIGVITAMTLQLCPAFDLDVTERQTSLEAALDALPQSLHEVDHYRFWYLPHSDRVWDWRATRGAPEHLAPAKRQPLAAWWHDSFIGYHLFQALLFAGSFLPSLIPAINRWYTARMFTAPKRARGPSHSMFTFDCLFRQHVTEWAIPVEHTATAMRELRRLIESNGFRVHLPIEVRFTRRDDIWLSPCQGRDSCYIGIIAYLAYGRGTEHEAYFAAFEALMASLDGRPHWAKRFGPEAGWLAGQYPHWADFQAVRRRLDPHGLLANAYTERVLGPISDEASR